MRIMILIKIQYAVYFENFVFKTWSEWKDQFNTSDFKDDTVQVSKK